MGGFVAEEGRLVDGELLVGWVELGLVRLVGFVVVEGGLLMLVMEVIECVYGVVEGDAVGAVHMEV